MSYLHRLSCGWQQCKQAVQFLGGFLELEFFSFLLQFLGFLGREGLPGKLVHYHVGKSEFVFVLEHYVFFNLFHVYRFKGLAYILHFSPK